MNEWYYLVLGSIIFAYNILIGSMLIALSQIVLGLGFLLAYYFRNHADSTLINSRQKITPSSLVDTLVLLSFFLIPQDKQLLFALGDIIPSFSQLSFASVLLLLYSAVLWFFLQKTHSQALTRLFTPLIGTTLITLFFQGIFYSFPIEIAILVFLSLTVYLVSYYTKYSIEKIDETFVLFAVAQVLLFTVLLLNTVRGKTVVLLSFTGQALSSYTTLLLSGYYVVFVLLLFNLLRKPLIPKEKAFMIYSSIGIGIEFVAFIRIVELGVFTGPVLDLIGVVIGVLFFSVAAFSGEDPSIIQAELIGQTIFLVSLLFISQSIYGVSLFTVAFLLLFVLNFARWLMKGSIYDLVTISIILTFLSLAYAVKTLLLLVYWDYLVNKTDVMVSVASIVGALLVMYLMLFKDLQYSLDPKLNKWNILAPLSGLNFISLVYVVTL